MLNVNMLGAVKLNFIMLSVNRWSDAMLSAIVPNVIMPSVVMLSVIMISVIAPPAIRPIDFLRQSYKTFLLVTDAPDK
jgi:hypothetical protein